MSTAQLFDERLAANELPEDAIGNELRVFGPPGTGKTTYLTGHISQAASRFGVRQVLVMSHTRAAAHELVSKDLAIPAENVATLHAVCYRALLKPYIAETITSKWNEIHPEFALSHRYNDQGEPTGRETIGDQALREINLLRARMVPQDRWPSTVAPFWRAWTNWKKSRNILDFTDLIENCLHDVGVAPGNPRAIICDEGQDFNPLQLALVRSWGKAASYLLIAGDDDQSLYSYAGADPRSLLLPKLADSQVRTLIESKRIPAAIHRYVVRHWSSRITIRQSKPFFPKAEEGMVRNEASGGFDVAGLANRLEANVAQGKTTMLLGSAHFALTRTMQELRRRGIPFGNSYRPDNLIWNPLGGKGNGAGRRIQCIAAARPRRHEDWIYKGQELKLWAEWIRADGTFESGAKEEIKSLDSDALIAPAWLASKMDAAEWETLSRHMEHSDAAIADWWQRRVLTKHHHDAQYAAKVVERKSLATTTEKPLLTVGTIHSVKGGQADTVFVLPDLTNRWKNDYMRGGATRDALLRLYYVACTRAQSTLRLCQPWRRGSSIEMGVPA